MARVLSEGGSVTFFKDAKPIKILPGKALTGVPRKILNRLERDDRVLDDGEREARADEKQSSKQEGDTKEK